MPTTIAQLAIVHDVPVVAEPVRSAFVTHASLLGREALQVEVDGVRRSVVGQFAPGLVRITMQIRLANRLAWTTLIPPSFPAAPDASPSVFLFVVQVAAIEEPGGVTATGPNEIRVLVSGTGVVRPSPDWDGSPYDFLRSTRCLLPIGTCVRYEPFAAPVEAGGVSGWRTVGFDADPRVRHIRMHLVLAADLANSR